MFLQTDTCRANYCGTKRLIELAQDMPQLRSFVFVSTFYVNNFKPYNSAVKEQVHELTLQLTGKRLCSACRSYSAAYSWNHRS